MKKFGLLLLLFLAFMLVTTAAFATSRYVQLSSQPPTETEQYYYAIFDNAGDAAVIAKLTFKNNENIPIRQFAVEIPGSDVQLINAVQEMFKERNETDKNQRYYQYQTFYSKLKTKTEKQLLGAAKAVIDVERPISYNETGTILLHYKAKGYTTKKPFGAYDFRFETIKTGYETGAVRVAVDAREGYVKGTGTRYGSGARSFTEPIDKRGYWIRSMNELSQPDLFQFPGEDFESPFLEDISRNMGLQWLDRHILNDIWNGLKPGESFTVNGAYADSWIRLNIGIVVMISLASLLIAGGLVFGTIKLARRSKKALFIAVAAGAATAVVQLIAWAAAWAILLNTGFLSQEIRLLIIAPATGAALVGMLIVPQVIIGRRYGPVFGIASAITTVSVIAIAMPAVILFLFTPSWI